MHGLVQNAYDAADKLDMPKNRVDELVDLYRSDPVKASHDMQIAYSESGTQNVMQYAQLCSAAPDKYVPNYRKLKSAGRITD